MVKVCEEFEAIIVPDFFFKSIMNLGTDSENVITMYEAVKSDTFPDQHNEETFEAYAPLEGSSGAASDFFEQCLKLQQLLPLLIKITNNMLKLSHFL